MDNSVLRKRLMTFKSAKGSLTNIGNDVILDVLRAWEQWPGTTADLYRDLELKKGQLSSIIRKAKKLVKSGAFESDFKEITIDQESGQLQEFSSCSGMELVWSKDKIIRFSHVDLLLDFLKKAA
jgi:hypothetical protein